MEKILTFSVVTPCFNSERYIAETIESVLSQRGPFKIQYIVVDGGSTDSTLDIIKLYMKKVEQGHYEDVCCGIDFKYISEHDNGMYDAISKGFARVSGEYCCYINSDDFYLTNAFKTVMSVFSYSKNIKWITGMPNVYTELGASIKRYLPFEYIADFIVKGVYGRDLSHIQQESVFWRSNLLEQIDFNKLSRFKSAGDFYLWHEFAKKNKLWAVDSLLSGFRSHATNKSKDLNGYNQEFNSIVSEKMTLRDKLKLIKHKKLWSAKDEIKRKYSKGIVSVFSPKLIDNFRKIEDRRVAENPNVESFDVPLIDKPRVSVVIGSFNRLPMIKLCIQAVRDELRETKHEIIIVDGGSTDGTLQWLLLQKDIITIVQHNRGAWLGNEIERKPWSYFMNLAFKSASGKYVCMLSDDSLIIPGAILNGLKTFEESVTNGSKTGAVAFYFRDYPIRKDYAVAINVGSLYVNHGIYLKQALEDAGYADENYHFYFADTDLVLKMKDIGYQCIVSENSFVEHYFEATPEIRASNNDYKKEHDRQRLINKWKGISYPESDYEKYQKVVGYWDWHPTGFNDKLNTINQLIECHDD